MALRGFLLALVACLGLDLPGGNDLVRWKLVGEAWLASRADEITGLLGGVTPESPTVDRVRPVISPREDLVFESLVEGMAARFSDDLASMPAKATPVEAPLSLEANRVAVPTMPGRSVLVVDVPAPPASRLERISAAVRLTRLAVDAWASVIHPEDDGEIDDERGDSL